MCSIAWFFIVGLSIVEGSNIVISDGLQQRLQLTNTSEKGLAKEYLESKFPFLKSNCVTDALKSFLPVCLEKGVESVDSTLRVEAAVKLSICEFRASGLEYIPNSCESWDMDSMMDCMIGLESSTQWWTTYSGNYQRLSSICFENSLPYEKQQILDLFLNVTTMYKDITDTLEDQLQAIVADSETTSKRHIERMTSMFQEYMDDFSQKAKLHEEDLENDFIAHRAEVDELIVRNTAAFEQELMKKDTQFMGSFDDILDATNKLASELERMDITKEIDSRNRAALERWTDVDEIVEKMYDAHKENHIQMSREWEHFLSYAREDISTISSDLVRSQSQVFEAMNDYDDMIRDNIQSSITKSVIPQLQAFKHQIMFEWQETAELVTQDVMQWNNEVAQKFQNISQNLNYTMGKVIELDNRISKLHTLFSHVQKTFELTLKAIRHTWIFLFCLATSRLFWAFALLCFCMPKVLRLFYPKALFLVAVNSLQLTFKWCMVLIMIFIGSKAGTLVVSNES